MLHPRSSTLLFMDAAGPRARSCGPFFNDSDRLVPAARDQPELGARLAAAAPDWNRAGGPVARIRLDWPHVFAAGLDVRGGSCAPRHNGGELRLRRPLAVARRPSGSRACAVWRRQSLGRFGVSVRTGPGPAPCSDSRGENPDFQAASRARWNGYCSDFGSAPRPNVRTRFPRCGCRASERTCAGCRRDHGRSDRRTGPTHSRDFGAACEIRAALRNVSCDGQPRVLHHGRSHHRRQRGRCGVTRPRGAATAQRARLDR